MKPIPTLPLVPAGQRPVPFVLCKGVCHQGQACPRGNAEPCTPITSLIPVSNPNKISGEKEK